MPPQNPMPEVTIQLPLHGPVTLTLIFRKLLSVWPSLAKYLIRGCGNSLVSKSTSVKKGGPKFKFPAPLQKLDSATWSYNPGAGGSVLGGDRHVLRCHWLAKMAILGFHEILPQKQGGKREEIAHLHLAFKCMCLYTIHAHSYKVHDRKRVVLAHGLRGFNPRSLG